MQVHLRQAGPGDHEAIRQVLLAAFPGPGEARLVSALRAAHPGLLELVAEEDGALVGHVLFSPVRIGEARGLGLAPLSVHPAHQRRGHGAALVRRGLQLLREGDAAFVVVLGDPGYYRRFGFSPASARSIGNEYGAGEAFQVLELVDGGLPPAGGLARYAPEFAESGV